MFILRGLVLFSQIGKANALFLFVNCLFYRLIKIISKNFAVIKNEK